MMGRSLKMAHWRSFLRRVTLHPKTSVPSPPPDGVSSPPPPPIPSPHLTLPIPSMHLYYEKACSNVMVSSHFFVCPAPTSLSPRQLAHGLPAQHWNQNHGKEEEHGEREKSSPPVFSRQSVNGKASIAVAGRVVQAVSIRPWECTDLPTDNVTIIVIKDVCVCVCLYLLTEPFYF